MGLLRRRSLSAIGVAALTLCVVLSGCGATSATRSRQGTATKAPVPWPTVPPTATTASFSGPIPQFPGCPPVARVSTQPQYVAVGALKVSIPQRIADYPSTLIPNNTPNAPYQIAANAVNNYAPNPPVNPHLSSGYIFQLCNETATSHTLKSLRVSISSFKASSGPVAVWHICEDGPYNAATRQTTGGCGGALGGVDWLEAALPSDSAGTSAPALANAHGGVSLPVSISPNASIQILVAIDGLNSQGTYALAFGVSMDGAAPVSLTPSDGPFVIAPSAVIWTGKACQTQAMQAHIPASTQDSYYVCPPVA